MRDIVELVENLRSGESAAHAYIIEGRSKEARNRFIGELISGLGCSSLDTVRMDMSGKSAYKVDDASAFSERLMMGAYGSFLAGIIDDADSMSEIVQNKLLKTIEEPHSSVVLLLGTSNPDHLLSTVRSRCMTLRVSDYGFEDEDAEEAARLDEIAEAAALMTDGSHFYEFREAINKCVKSKSDALLLVDALEDSLREGMLTGDDPAAYAECIELAETARADIERDMDKIKALSELNIVPVSVSYEWESCDILKALELYERKRVGRYIKKPGEDLTSILTGIAQPKGRVNITFCPQLTDADLRQFENSTNNEYHRQVAQLIDERIIDAYQLTPNNYIAHDLRYGQQRYCDYYSDEEYSAFETYLERLNTFDIPEPDVLRDIYLGIYANPVDSKRALLKGKNEKM